MFYHEKDIPLLSIRKEKFNQPIFGCNNLSMSVAPQNQWGERYQFDVRFEFTSGGANTFLRIFWKLMAVVNETRNLPGLFIYLLIIISCSTCS
jgi:hypothetical protein